MARRGRPKGSKNKTKRGFKARSAARKETKVRATRCSFEESVICLAKNLEIKIKPTDTFDRVLHRVKSTCRRNSTQITLKETPELYNTWVNILLREASADVTV